MRFPESYDASVERVWQLAAGSEPGVVWAGTEPGAVWRSSDSGRSFALRAAAAVASEVSAASPSGAPFRGLDVRTG